MTFPKTFGLFLATVLLWSGGALAFAPTPHTAPGFCAPKWRLFPQKPSSPTLCQPFDPGDTSCGAEERCVPDLSSRKIFWAKLTLLVDADPPDSDSAADQLVTAIVELRIGFATERLIQTWPFMPAPWSGTIDEDSFAQSIRDRDFASLFGAPFPEPLATALSVATGVSGRARILDFGHVIWSSLHDGRDPLASGMKLPVKIGFTDETLP